MLLKSNVVTAASVTSVVAEPASARSLLANLLSFFVATRDDPSADFATVTSRR